MKSKFLIIWQILKVIFGRKEPTEVQKAKKQIKVLNHEIKKYSKLAKRALSHNHLDQLNHFTSIVRDLKSRRAELYKVLSE